MDPDAALRMLLEALEDQDHEQVMELTEGLRSWLHGGGFPPQTIGAESLGNDWHRAIALAACHAADESVVADD